MRLGDEARLLGGGGSVCQPQAGTQPSQSWAGGGAGTDRGPKGEGLGHLLEQEEDPVGGTGSKGQDGKARPAW